MASHCLTFFRRKRNDSPQRPASYALSRSLRLKRLCLLFRRLLPQFLDHSQGDPDEKRGEFFLVGVHRRSKGRRRLPEWGRTCLPQRLPAERHPK
jgi:hypothetical protein